MKNAVIALYQTRNRQLEISRSQSKLLDKIKDWVDESSDFDSNQQLKLLQEILDGAIKAHAILDSCLEKSSLYQLKTNKMRLILERTLDSLSLEDLDCIFKGNLPPSIHSDLEEWPSLPFQLVEEKQFFGTVKVDAISTLLFCLAYSLNNQKESPVLKKCLEDAKESALCHSIAIDLEIDMELPVSPFIQIGQGGQHKLLVVNGGYAFGGMRKERANWCDDPLLGPEDCTSFVAKSHGSKFLYSTVHQYAFFRSESGDSSVVQTWKSEYPEMSADLQIIPKEEVQLGDICMKRTGISKDKALGTSGHSGIVLEKPQINSVTMVNANRNIETWDLDGIGIGKMSLQANENTQFAFFRPIENEDTLSRAGVGTPFFQQKQSAFKEEPQDYNVLCQQLDAKYFFNRR